MRNGIRILAAAGGFALFGAAVPAQAADFLGIPLWESYPGQYSARPYYNYAPAPPGTYYDPYTNRYYRR